MGHRSRSYFYRLEYDALRTEAFGIICFRRKFNDDFLGNEAVVRLGGYFHPTAPQYMDPAPKPSDSFTNDMASLRKPWKGGDHIQCLEATLIDPMKDNSFLPHVAT
jgi:hypothetical protein